MFPGNKITFEYLNSHIGMMVKTQSATALNQATQLLTFRILNELKPNEIEKLQRVSQSHISGNSVDDVVTLNILNSILQSAKEAKPDFDKLQKAKELVSQNQLDEAETLLDTIKNPTCQTDVCATYRLISEKYLSKGEEKKAKKLEDKFNPTIVTTETPSEKIVANTGEQLFLSGLNNLRTVIPHSFPTDRDAKASLQGLHTMSQISAGQKRDLSLEKESVSDLQKKLDDANRRLDIERRNFNAACNTGNPNIIQAALAKKQAVMQEVLSLQSALHHNGVSQTTKDDVPQTIDAAVQKGMQDMFKLLQQNFNKSTKEEEPDCKTQ